MRPPLQVAPDSNPEDKSTRLSWKEREDVKSLAVGFLFSLSLTFLIDLNAYKLEKFPHLPDQGPLWYFWALSEPTVWTRLSAWGPYFCHQIIHWYLIYYGQKYVRSPTTKLQPVHYACLALNGGFSILHFFQTHTMYDGLAQEVNVTTPQIAVIIMLIWVLLMENKRRGLIFGKPGPFLSNDLIQFARKYHGYYFSWAIVYTFWFHPMEGTSGHLWGFFYTFLLMIQGSLFLTRVHMNKWWTVCLELLVALHGTIVALGQPFGQIWPMFLFGFLIVFLLSQMHGLGLPVILKGLITLIFTIAYVFMYSDKPLDKLNEPFRIPFIDYVGVYILAGVLYALMWCCRTHNIKN